MFKKITISFIAMLCVLSFAMPSMVGFSLWNLGHAVSVSTAMSAKLACSAKYITGLNETQVIEDLSSYSPAVKVVELKYNNAEKNVTASLFGMAESKAQYRAATGCSLVMTNNNQLDQVVAKSVTVTQSVWPTGNFNYDIDPGMQVELDRILNKDNDDGLNSRAMLVVKDGDIIAESYGENIRKTTPLLGWSMGKSLTAIMLGRMQQLGLVDMKQDQLFSQWKDDDRSNIRLEQLLQMSSGLEFDETYAPGSDATHMLFTAASASDVAMNSPLIHVPDEHFSYSSGTTNLLTRYMHQKLGAKTQQSTDFLIDEIFQPLGMKNSIFETDSSGVFVGSSYIYASGRDWARLGLLMLNNGSINGQQLLAKAWVEQARQPNKSKNDKRYGFQFWLNSGEEELRWPTLPKDAYAMMGNRQQSVMIIPSENIVLVRLGWTKDDYPMESNYRALLNYVAKD
jgi:CubicO group peptidase (beta-lactamase class C family)